MQSPEQPQPQELQSQFLDNLQLAQQARLPELSKEQHEQLMLAVNNPALRNYLQLCVNINAAQLLKENLLIGGNHVPYLLKVSYVRGMISLAESLLELGIQNPQTEGASNAVTKP